MVQANALFRSWASTLEINAYQNSNEYPPKPHLNQSNFNCINLVSVLPLKVIFLYMKGPPYVYDLVQQKTLVDQNQKFTICA